MEWHGSGLLGLSSVAVQHLKQWFTGKPASSIPAQSSDTQSVPSVRDACLTICTTLGTVADTITFRPDEDTSRALSILTEDGTPVSAAVRAALIDAARHKAAKSLREEAEALAEDPIDRAEAAQVLRDMEALRAR